MDIKATAQRGRKKLPDNEKKKGVTAFVPQKMIDDLTYDTCKEIAELAIIAEFTAKHRLDDIPRPE